MCHVLIIEDEVLIALHLQGVLEENGATSFDIAETEADAVAAARDHRPALITSDVKLRVGSGPRAVEIIQAELGPLPVIFITGTPEACDACQPPARVLEKPIHDPSVAKCFRELAPL